MSKTQVDFRVMKVATIVACVCEYQPRLRGRWNAIFIRAREIVRLKPDLLGLRKSSG